MMNNTGTTRPFQPSLSVLQPAIQQYIQAITAAGYNGANTQGNGFWTQAPVQDAMQKYFAAVGATTPQEQQTARLTIPAGNYTEHNQLGEILTNPIFQGATLAIGGMGALGGLGGAALGADAAGAGAAGAADAGAAGTAAGTGTGLGDLFSGVGGSALKGAAIGGLTSGLTGGNIGEGILSGGIGGGSESYLGDLFNGAGYTFPGAGGDINGSPGGFFDPSAADTSPTIEAARSAVSDASTAAIPSSSTLANYLPGTGGSVAGGGSAGGFMSVPSGTEAFGVPELNTAGIDNMASGVTGTGSSSIAKGLGSMFTPSNLAGTALKGGLSYLLNKNNSGGYGAVQGAQNSSAADYQPFLNTGTGATNTLANLYGLNGPQAAQSATQNWQNTPGYQFALNQGVNALDASAASKGMLMSGNQQQAVQKYGTGLADGYYQNYLNGLNQQVGAGLNAAQGVATGKVGAAQAFGQSKANNAGAFTAMLPSIANWMFPTPQTVN